MNKVRITARPGRKTIERRYCFFAKTMAIQPISVQNIAPILIQQTARVICEGKELTGEQWESVHKVIDTTYIKELYAPGFAD